MQVIAAEDAGFDGNRLARLVDYLNETYLASGKIPHAQLLISRAEQPVLFASLGEGRAGDAGLRDDALFRIASMTKPVTSVAFLMLVEEGKVALDQPVHSILPEFRNLPVYADGGAGEPFTTVPTNSPMRMIDLLRHTSGLTYSFQERTAVDAAYRALNLDDFHAPRDLDAMIAALAEIPLEFSPGTRWNYSISTDVLGAVIQRVSGQRLDAFFDERIFRPLAMHDTFFTVPSDKADRLTDAYTLHPENGRMLTDAADNSRWTKQRRFLSGGGGLISTTQDYHRFCRMLLRGGELDGVRLLGPKTVSLMTSNHLPGGADLTQMSSSLFSESQNAGVGFGLGFAVTMDPVQTMMPGTSGEFYWGGIFSTAFFIDPVERLIMIFMTQLMPSSSYPIRRDLKTLIYSAITRSYA